MPCTNRKVTRSAQHKSKRKTSSRISSWLIHCMIAREEHHERKPNFQKAKSLSTCLEEHAKDQCAFGAHGNVEWIWTHSTPGTKQLRSEGLLSAMWSAAWKSRHWPAMPSQPGNFEFSFQSRWQRCRMNNDRHRSLVCLGHGT